MYNYLYLYILCALLQEKGMLSEKSLYIWYYSSSVLLTFLAFWRNQQEKMLYRFI